MLLLFGFALGCRCGSSRHQGTSGTPVELLVAVDSEPKEGFDPLMGWGRYGSPLFQSTLLRRDEQQRLVPELAEVAELSEDRLTWRVRIRQDARFHDGAPVTAKDVVFTFNQARRAEGKTDVSALREAVATGPWSLELKLREPQITFVQRLATLGIVPAHAYGMSYGRNPIGSGPYRLVRWDEGRQAILQANDRYYGTKPLIPRVVLLYLGEDAAFAAARAGVVHAVRVPASLAAQRVPGMRVVSVKSVDNRGISFPFLPRRAAEGRGEREVGNDVTASLAIRRAINVAVNRAALVRGVLDGFGSPAFGPASHLPWDQPEGEVADGDIEGARKILDADGWGDSDGDGILEKGRTKAEFDLLYPADDLTRQGLAIAVADMLRPVGIRAVVLSRSWEDIYERMSANAVLFGFGSLDQMEMHNLFCGSRPGSREYNAGLYLNPRVDEYLNQAQAARSEVEAIDLWKKAQWDGQTGFSPRGDAPWAWLVNVDHVYFVDERLDVGKPDLEQHGTSIVSNVARWKWKEGP
jgi:peptide/nickel transport system substrate-binding protein